MAPKYVLITGCSASGLGAALASEYASRRGEDTFHVFATARNPSKVPADLAALPNVDVLPLDVTSRDSIARCIAAISDITGGGGRRPRLDVLVNNAGHGFIQPLLHVDIDDAKSVFDVNVWGLVAMSQACVPLLSSRESKEEGGLIVNIASIGATSWMPWQGIYNSSKSAVTMLSETMRLELQPLGIRVQTAMVGCVRTGIYSGSSSGRFASLSSSEGDKKKEEEGEGGSSGLLPSGSPYAPIEDIILAQSRGAFQEPVNEEAEVTARNLVNDAVAGKTGKVWRGGVAGKFKVIAGWAPGWLMDRLVQRRRGLDVLRKVYGTREEKGSGGIMIVALVGGLAVLGLGAWWRRI